MIKKCEKWNMRYAMTKSVKNATEGEIAPLYRAMHAFLITIFSYLTTSRFLI